MYSFEAQWPIEVVAFDTLGPLPVTLSDRKHVLVGIDLCTKFVFVSPLTNIQKEVIGVEIKKFISCFGIPNYLLTDNSPSFVNEIMKDIESCYKFDHRKSTARHHRGNSPAERAIQNVEQKVLTLTHDPRYSVNWDEVIYDVAFNINTTSHTSTGYSPYRLMFGLEANEPSDLVEFR